MAVAIVSANRAGMHGAKVLLIEGNELGYLNQCGLSPKKVMWQASEMLEMIKRDATSYGIIHMWINLISSNLWITVKNILIFTHSISKRLRYSNRVEVIRCYAQFVDTTIP